MKIIKQIIIIIIPILFFSCDTKNQSFDHYKPYDTVPSALFCSSYEDISLFHKIAIQGDPLGYADLLVNKRCEIIPGKSFVVFVEEERGDFVKVRPKGGSSFVWMDKLFIETPGE